MFRATTRAARSPPQFSCLRIPRLGLIVPRCYSSEPPPTAQPTQNLTKIIKDSIKATGPLSIAQYTQFCLSHPNEGYYMKGDIFGSKGDFVTSPDISQVFGELVGLWLLNHWMQSGQPSNVRLIELGPGKGTLMDDVLRTIKKFPGVSNAVTKVEIVENSALLAGIVTKRLESHGVPIKWHPQIEDVENDGSFTLVLAHEFFDALPIHILRKTDEGFREVMIGVNESHAEPAGDKRSESALDVDSTLPFEPKSSPSNPSCDFRFVLAPGLSPTASVLGISSPRFQALATGTQIEVSPRSWTTARRIAELLSREDGNGGTALFVDYGDDKFAVDSFRAYKQHKSVGVFETPGSCDLTADVDFAYLREATSLPGLAHGFMTQRDFLLQMGVEVRTNMLASRLPPERQGAIRGAVDRLIDPAGMGTQYKFFSVSSGQSPPYPFALHPDSQTAAP